MTATLPPSALRPAPKAPAWLTAAQGLAVFLLLFLFLCGIRGLGDGLKAMGGELLDTVFRHTSSPFIGLMVGILATTLVQSSSVSTSMIVAMVAAPFNALPLADAIPMIMGANIGTTVTNTLVSLGHIGRPDEFRRAFAAATCHDFFNFLAVLVFLPLELATGFLERASLPLAQLLAGGRAGGDFPNPIKDATGWLVRPSARLLEGLAQNPRTGAALLVAASAAAIFVALLLIVRTMRRLMATRMEGYLTRALDRNGAVAIVVGVVVTIAVQSSSITTSVLVPLAGAGLVSLRQIFPVTLGANLGTTITALLASMAVPDETAVVATQIALVHLLFNATGTLLVYPFGPVRRIPLRMAEWLAEVAVARRRWALFYVFGLFYAAPGLLVLLDGLFRGPL